MLPMFTWPRRTSEMGKRRGGGRLKGANATCCSCGKWADKVCSQCGRLVCESCARQWPVSQRKKVKGELKIVGTATIITCPANKCQSRLPLQVKADALELLKVPGDFQDAT